MAGRVRGGEGRNIVGGGKRVGGEHMTDIAKKRTKIWLLAHMVLAAVFVLLVFFLWENIRAFMDFRTAGDLTSWRVLNTGIYIAYTFVTVVVACGYLHLKVAPVAGEAGNTPNGVLVFFGVIFQITLLGLMILLLVLVWGGSAAITYHLVRLVPYFVVLVIMVVAGILTLGHSPQQKRPKPQKSIKLQKNAPAPASGTSGARVRGGQ